MQKSRWSEAELQLIRDVFKDEAFIHDVRDVMLCLSDTFEHQTTPAVLAVLRKSLLPSLEKGVPLLMQQDLCQLSIDHIGGFNAEEGINRIEAYDIAENYIKRRLKVLEGELDKRRGSGESLTDLKDSSRASGKLRFIRMLAYLQIINYVEKNLSQLVAISNYKEETPAEREKRIEQDSSR